MILHRFYVESINAHFLFKGDITLVAMGPLTNLAVALRMAPDISSKLKDLVIMGGNIHGRYFLFLFLGLIFCQEAESVFFLETYIAFIHVIF